MSTIRGEGFITLLGKHYPLNAFTPPDQTGTYNTSRLYICPFTGQTWATLTFTHRPLYFHTIIRPLDPKYPVFFASRQGSLLTYKSDLALLPRSLLLRELSLFTNESPICSP